MCKVNWAFSGTRCKEQEIFCQTSPKVHLTLGDDKIVIFCHPNQEILIFMRRPAMVE
jgi:hypothetical protein